MPTSRDRRTLTFLIGAEYVLGKKSLSWEKLPKLGLTLNKTEARSYLRENGLINKEREALYEFLFENHPELKLSVFSADQ